MSDWLTIKSDYDAMSEAAAKQVAILIRENNRKGKSTVLGLATGSTPTGLYKELVRLYEEEQLDFSNVITFNLDNYWPCDDAHEKSYVKEMNEKLFDHIIGGERGIKRENIHIPSGKVVEDAIEEHCIAYEEKMKQVGGIDLQIVGIGKNGHIGFNEPEHLADGTPWYKLRTRKVDLSPATIKANGLDGTGIKSAITMGIDTIMQAKSVLLLASGPDKAQIINETFGAEGLNLKSPAGILAGHEHCHLLIDEAAAAAIDKGEAAIKGKGVIARG